MIPAEGTYLDFRNHAEVIGRALLMHLTLAYRTTLDYSSEDDLRAWASKGADINDDAAPLLAKVGAAGRGAIWAWYRYSVEPDELGRVVRPADVAIGDPGRWIKQRLPSVSACGTTRYYQHAEYLAEGLAPRGGSGEVGSLWTRCNGQTPALFVSLADTQAEEASQTLAYHRVKSRYRIRVISANWRGGVEARMTPGRSEDAAADPGSLRMVGDIRDYLTKDNRLSGTLGLLKIQLGAHQSIFSRAKEGVICDQLEITTICGTYTPALPCELKKPWRIWADLQDHLGRLVMDDIQVGASA